MDRVTCMANKQIEHVLTVLGKYLFLISVSGGSVVKNLPASQEAPVQYLGWQDLLGEEMATLSSILAWRTLWTKEPGGLSSMGSHRVKTPLRD